jgi:hypothetical protein
MLKLHKKNYCFVTLNASNELLPKNIFSYLGADSVQHVLQEHDNAVILPKELRASCELEIGSGKLNLIGEG